MAEDRIITLNVGSQQITGAVFSKTAGGGLRLDRLERREFIGDPAESEVRDSQGAAALKEIVSSLKIKGAKTTYVVSSFPVLMKFASLPALDGEQVDQIVEFEAQQQVPYPINEVVWGYQLMGEPDDIEVEVVLAAVKSDELNEIDEMVNASGVSSLGAEISPITLYNALRFNYSDLEGATLLVDIGARTTDMIFMEDGKVFIRTVKIGGADITRAIAKEFGNDFGASEFKKVADGFVALGGAYADHEDPEIAGISKVVRNSLTRLHSEIMRTINFYRSQQSGSAPSFVLLSGASASLPFIREFFAEKLSLPVDHFNAFRNVTVDGSVDAGMVQSSAHSLGELVGSALAQIGDVPVDIELIPESVQSSKDLQKKKPALIIAVAALAVFLGGLGFYFQQASKVAFSKGDAIERKASDLKKYNDEIDDLKDGIEKVNAQKSPYVDAVKHRVYWVQVFKKLAAKMDGDIIFMTVIEPLANGVPVIADQDSDLLDVSGSVDATIDAFSIEGLWRENASGGSKVVTDYFNRLKADSEDPAGNAFFALEGVDIGQIIEVDAGTSDDRYAYPFKMKLPLPDENKVKFTK
ncbi:MAG: pilus assembly protein PilM [Verrucomicrobiales bacterium]|nr:pilus assembly protein PilM [Verrucomicrobiales bacterium]